jgi:hypothetical protein
MAERPYIRTSIVNTSPARTDMPRVEAVAAVVAR